MVSDSHIVSESSPSPVSPVSSARDALAVFLTGLERRSAGQPIRTRVYLSSATGRHERFRLTRDLTLQAS